MKFVSDAVDKAYGEIRDSQMPDDPQGGPRTGLITLYGDVIDGDDRRNPIIQVTHIRLTETAKP
jgi:hypothetical protein